MIKSYSIGQDELHEYDFDYVKEASHIIYDYTNEGYGGHGQAIIIKDKEYYYAYLGHCSCYGPLEEFSFGVSYINLILLKEAMIKDTYGTDLETVERLISKVKEEWEAEQG